MMSDWAREEITRPDVDDAMPPLPPRVLEMQREDKRERPWLLYAVLVAVVVDAVIHVSR